ncbi:MAG: aminopeptidase P family protein [Candidatus Neomarinimicrobiota bacterium]|nr:aminopeptidase P family protein [Candidatus Neomarinimicrobiota bacterium]
MKNIQEEKIKRIRSWMKINNLNAYIVPHDDEYMSEYLPPQNERLDWLTGFNGSAGIAIITLDTAAIFIDGRYTVQVTTQVDTNIFQIKHLINDPYLKWIESTIGNNSVVGFDPKLHTKNWLKKSNQILDDTIILKPIEENPIDSLWKKKPIKKINRTVLLDEKYSGLSSTLKRMQVAKLLKKNNIDGMLITSLDSICWLLNIRGNDIPCNPVILSHAMIFSDSTVNFFTDKAKISEGFMEHVGSGVNLYSEKELKVKISNLKGQRIGFDMNLGNVWLFNCIKSGGAILENINDPCILLKSCKNDTEADGMRKCHIRDGVAVVKFLAWIDKQIVKKTLLNEGELSDKLEKFRSLGDKFMGISFDTISALDDNAAMCHYKHTNQDTPKTMKQNSIYLVDSGGQYLDGTTDITRTIAIGSPGSSAKKAFTLVLKGHIALSEAIFPEGTSGMQIDSLARQYLWRHGMDYDHGTGHGVGHYLNVHEGPQGIGKKGSSIPLKKGMVLSNEPGYYKTNEFGFRCENLVLVVEKKTAGELNTLGFENLTMVPFDRNLIEFELMNNLEIQWLNDYHREVWQKLSPYLLDDDLKWLENQTKEIKIHNKN